MASAAAISALPRPSPRLHHSLVTSASTLLAMSSRLQPSSSSSSVASVSSLPFHSRRIRSSLTTPSTVKKATSRWTPTPVSAIRPATEDKSIFLVTLDLSNAPDLVDSYTNPGQYLLVRVPNIEPEKPLKPAYMVIASPPRSGPRFEFLVKSVPGTTAGRLCNLGVGDIVELGPVVGEGLAIQNIIPPDTAKTVVLFADGVGISPIRALIDFGFAARERTDVRLYYGATDLKAMPFQEEFEMWEKSGVKVIPVISEPVQDPFLKSIEEIIVNPDSTGAVLLGSTETKEEVTGALLEYGVPHEKILSIAWSP